MSRRWPRTEQSPCVDAAGALSADRERWMTQAPISRFPSDRDTEELPFPGDASQVDRSEGPEREVCARGEVPNRAGATT